MVLEFFGLNSGTEPFAAVSPGNPDPLGSGFLFSHFSFLALWFARILQAWEQYRARSSL